MEKEKLENFKFRLKTIGRISHHDIYWKGIFKHYNLEWKVWWDDYCDGFHNLTGRFEDDDTEEDGNRRRYFGSIFDDEMENLFIKWLYQGKKKDLLPFYNWFKEYMEGLNEQHNIAIEKMILEKPEKKKEKESGYIYLIKSQNLYKIGRAKYPQDRFKKYITENPFGIRVIFQKEVDDYVGVEAELLKKFQDKKYRGEWFRLNKEDVDLIKEFLK